MVRIRLIVLLVCSIALVESQTLVLNEYYALQNLSAALGHSFCSTTCTDCSSWTSVFCNGGFVTLVDWDTMSLHGTISSYIGQFSQLLGLFLQTNSISGTIPSEIGLFSQLTSLYLNGNQLNGKIPSEIVLLTNIGSLYLSINHLTGEIPSQIANIPGITGGCSVWFSNNLTCDPNYLNPGVTRCMGTQSEYDTDGGYDGDLPDCPTPTTSSSPSTTSISSPKTPSKPVVGGVAGTSIIITGLPHGSSSVLAIKVLYRRTGLDASYTQAYASLTAGEYGIRNLLPCTWYNAYYKVKGPSGWGLDSPLISVKTTCA